MLISKELAGFTGAQADDLRKAIGKKNRAAMAKLEPLFREGCAKNGVAQSTIDWLWATNEKSADYSFNKSHAACYGLISYRTAWLKANYCAEYMAALISSVMDTKDKVPFFAARCEEMGIEILPPDVNLSDHEFVVVDGNIRFGLDAVKGVGYAAVEAIKRAREDAGPFVSIWDFCERVDPRAVNKRSIEALIKCGAFGSTGASRKGMLQVLEAAQSVGQKAQQDAEIGQGSIFDLFDGGGSNGAANGAAAAFAGPTHPPIPEEEFDKNELLAHEKDAIGLFLSMHPLKEVREALLAKVDRPLSDLPQVKDGEWITVGGIITAARKLKTRTGNMMMFATLDDLEGSIELIFFGDQLSEYEHVAQVDQIVMVRGRVGNDDRGLTIKVQACEAFQPSVAEVEEARAAAAVVSRAPEPLMIVLDAARLPASILEELKHVFGNHTGESDVVLAVHTSSGPRTLRLGTDFRVDPTPSLRAELARILGPEALAAREPQPA
jgi:DNA polymerase-3 subunit alpha